MSPMPSIVQAIEAKAGTCITIDSECNPSSLDKCQPQEQCLLFSLPAELRDIIWVYAFQQEPDVEFADNPDLSCGHHPSSTALTSTCRRLWLETNAISFPKGTHKSWHTGGELQTKNLVEKLTVLNRSRLTALHVILEGCWISFSKDYTYEELPLWPAKLIVTILSWPWEMMPGTRELGTSMHIYVRDLLLDDSIRNTHEVEFHLEERVEQIQPGVARRQPGLARLHYVQRRNLDIRSDEGIDDTMKYWELQPVESEPCRFWTRRIPDNRLMKPEDPNSVEYLTYKFTWRRIAAFPDDYRSTANAGHTSRGDGSYESSVESVGSPVTPLSDEEHNIRRWETRWKREKSLLKFAH